MSGYGSHGITVALFVLALLLPPPHAGSARAEGRGFIDGVVADTEKLVRIETYRTGSNEELVLANIEKIKAHFQEKADAFNGTQKSHKLSLFEWKGSDKEDVNKKYWVFGFRAGKGPRKVAILAHLDTVPPGNLDWKPFEPRLENRLYNGQNTSFLIGRGAIDDKGPAVVAFEVLTGVLKAADADPAALDGVTLEVLFDSSEETDMSTPHYFTAQPAETPAFGVVFDAFWTVRAEKGIERPVFTIAADANVTRSQGYLTLAGLESAEGSVNMIPTSASARIAGWSDFDGFAATVQALYRAYQFDDPAYRPAELKITRDGKVAVLTTLVAGAQHGSAPEQNRAKGANPVVSLTNFLASLIDRGLVANNAYGEMCHFIRWGWGTRVFGEAHPDLLLRTDTVFKEGNGTSYALTQLRPDGKGGISLALDVRYAIGHHGTGWDGREGLLKGDSLFKSVFTQLVEQYRAESGGTTVGFSTSTAYGPDIRDPRGANFVRINNAYRSAIGENSPMLAIGGGTDAKDHLTLVAAGSLFTTDLGPPINFHGLNEGAPLIDLENSAAILTSLLEQELGTARKLANFHEGAHKTLDVR